MVSLWKMAELGVFGDVKRARMHPVHKVGVRWVSVCIVRAVKKGRRLGGTARMSRRKSAKGFLVRNTKYDEE